MTIDWIDIAITVLTTGFFSLIGFVWRFSHKVTALEKDVEIYKRRTAKMEKDHDKVMDRMYSIAKSRSEFLTRDSYREDSREIQDALNRLHNRGKNEGRH
jgi:cytochrome c-type biogenesis protein CcmH/NrfG